MAEGWNGLQMQQKSTFFSKKGAKYIHNPLLTSTNYYPYGMLLPERNGNATEDEYRYGFNGMQADGQIKGERNNYDFGARMYDPRVGRWLIVDPLAGKQPDQSPYKAFYNNPIFWQDPDGGTEYETIIIRDQRTGKTLKVYKSISNKLKTDGQVYTISRIPFTPAGHYQDYYDYRHTTTYTFTTDGKLIVEKTNNELLKKNGAKMSDNVSLDYIFGTVAEEGAVYDPDDPFVQAGGFYMTGGSGQGTKYHSKNADYVGDIDMLLGILSNYSASGSFKLTNKGFHDSDGLYKMLETLMEQMDKSVEKIDKLTEVVEEIVEEYGDKNSSSDEMTTPKNDIEIDTLWSRDGEHYYPLNGEAEPANPVENKENRKKYYEKHSNKAPN